MKKRFRIFYIEHRVSGGFETTALVPLSLKLYDIKKLERKVNLSFGYREYFSDIESAQTWYMKFKQTVDRAVGVYNDFHSGLFGSRIPLSLPDEISIIESYSL